jgi:hypothetical protein
MGGELSRVCGLGWGWVLNSPSIIYGPVGLMGHNWPNFWFVVSPMTDPR